MRRFLASPGSQTMTEFCEQVNPRVLLEMRQTRPFPEMRRVQESWVAAPEKRALLWLAARTPRWIGPDHLDYVGIGGAARSRSVLFARGLEPVCTARQ